MDVVRLSGEKRSQEKRQTKKQKTLGGSSPRRQLGQSEGFVSCARASFETTPFSPSWNITCYTESIFCSPFFRAADLYRYVWANITQRMFGIFFLILSPKLRLALQAEYVSKVNHNILSQYWPNPSWVKSVGMQRGICVKIRGLLKAKRKNRERLK